MVAMLDDSQQKFLISLYCCIIQHGRHVFCSLILLGMVGNLQWRSKVVGTLVKTVQKITKESFSTTIVIFKGTI